MKKKFFIVGLGLIAVHSIQAQAPVVGALFSQGDDMAKAEVEYDDSGWNKISITAPWTDQNVDEVKFGWYRMHLNIPSSLKDEAKRTGVIIFNMGQIDDADEVYLNGKLIGKTGRMPADEGGFASAWSDNRHYIVDADDKIINWDGDNVLAVRCYNDGGPGGMFGSRGVTVSVPRPVDGVSLSFVPGKKGSTDVKVNSRYAAPVKGKLKVEIVETETGKASPYSTGTVTASNKKPGATHVADVKDGTYVKATFTDDETGKAITARTYPKYILTPAAPAAPRFNTAPMYGVRPGSPVHYRFGVSGERPMTFSAENLPAGISLNPANGVLSGMLDTAGNYTFDVTASNDKGTATQKFTLCVGDRIALTPPMGWNSWNCWGLNVNQDRVIASAQAIIDKGLADYGYSYINVDDSWEAPERNADGTIAVNEKFPSMAALGEWLHGEGLKFGIYSSPGDLTCGCYLGSLGHELQDAQTYNDWGIDYLKYDWCGYHKKHSAEKDNTTTASYIRPYVLMGEYLRRQPRDIFYSLCQYGMAEVWKWGEMVDANSWRTTADITDTWESLADIGFNRQAGLAKYAGPGHWNDPDMLVVGKVGWSDNLRDSRLTPDEQYTHITLWSLLASNMLIGCDVSQIDDFTINLLCNNEVNAVNQDIMGMQADRDIVDGDIQIWTRPLSDGTRAVGIFNVGVEGADVDFSKYLGELGLYGLTSVRDLWRQQNLPASDLNYFIPSHGVKYIKIK